MPPTQDAPVTPAIPADDDVFVFPATLAQGRFWLLDQLVPGGNPALNTTVVARLRGALDRPAFERAFDALIDRHESLRTTFQYEGGELCQLIAPTATLRPAYVDTRDFPETERPSVPAHLSQSEAGCPFDLARGPLLRALVVCENPVDHTLVLTLHHIICDGWSNGVLLHELGQIYDAFTQGKPSPLPPLTFQFADFAQWQQDHAAAGGFDADLRYWREKLGGPLPVLDLPTDWPRGPVNRTRVEPAATRWRRFPEPLATALKTLAAREGASSYMLYLAAFNALLARYDANGGSEVLVGTPCANRPRAELEPIVGLFVNPLLLRTDLSGEPTVRELLTRTRTTVLQAFEHGAVPFERVLDGLESRRLQVNFLCGSAFTRANNLTNLEVIPVDPPGGGAMYEWDASVIEDAEGARIGLEYNASLFDAPTIDRVLANYESLLAAIAAPGGLETRIAQLPMSPAADSGPVLAWREHVPATTAAWAERFLTLTTGPSNGELGHAKPGVTLRVIDRHGADTPVGVPGEIRVDPAGHQTGDLGRRNSTGAIEWLGSESRQMVDNGQRVDFGAVEKALLAHPHIREALVRRHDDVLAAWIRSDGAPAALFSPEQLRAFLRERLAEPSIPTAFASVREFPVTPAGWLDESRLPDPLPVATAAGAGEGAAYLTIHYQLIDVWQELLHVPRVGIHDDFFALGGNSLLALRMLARAEALCGRKILPAMLFRQATIEGLADAILQGGTDGPPPELIEIQTAGTRAPIFYLHGDMTGGGYYCMKLSRQLGPDQPFYAIPPMEITDWRALPGIGEMAERHLRAIRAVRPHGPYIIGGFCLAGLVALEVAQRLFAAGEIVERLLLVDVTARNSRLKRLRRWAERLGGLLKWDTSHRLYHFCRWHFLIERFDRWRRLGWAAQWAIVRRRFGRALPVPHAKEPAPPPPIADLAPRDRGGSAADGTWFDDRWDVPLVFLWAEGGYQVQSYSGPTTLLLSHDLLGPKAEEPAVREWSRHLSNFEIRELAGSHLASITEHVEGLAETVRKALQLQE